MMVSGTMVDPSRRITIDLVFVIVFAMSSVTELHATHHQHFIRECEVRHQDLRLKECRQSESAEL